MTTHIMPGRITPWHIEQKSLAAAQSKQSTKAFNAISFDDQMEPTPQIQHIAALSTRFTDYFQVESSSGDLPHLAWICWRYDGPETDNDFVGCDCTGFRMRKDCSHIRDVRVLFTEPETEPTITCPTPVCECECEWRAGEGVDYLWCKNDGDVTKDYEADFCQ